MFLSLRRGSRSDRDSSTARVTRLLLLTIHIAAPAGHSPDVHTHRGPLASQLPLGEPLLPSWRKDFILGDVRCELRYIARRRLFTACTAIRTSMTVRDIQPSVSHHQRTHVQRLALIGGCTFKIVDNSKDEKVRKPPPSSRLTLVLLSKNTFRDVVFVC